MKNLNNAFLKMRHRGLITILGCCRSCALNGMVEEVKNRVQAGKETMGCVLCYGHEAFFLHLGEDFLLFYNQIEFENGRKIGVIPEQVGKIVCDCLSDYGVGYDWDGDPDSGILVKTKIIDGQVLITPRH